MGGEDQDDFKLSTRRVLEAMGWEKSHRFKSPGDERYLLHQVVVEIGNRLYHVLDETTYKNGIWPVDPALLTALRAALPDHTEGYAGQSIAQLLARSGARDPEVSGALHPWDRLMFRWQEEGLAAADVAAILRDASLVESMSESGRARIDAWIANPVSALSCGFFYVLAALFNVETRLLIASVRDSGFDPRHDQLFQQLLARAVPAVDVAEVSQESDSEEQLIDVTEHAELIMRTPDAERRFKVGDDAALSQEGVRVYRVAGGKRVRFSHGGRTHSFPFKSEGTWMDLPSVLNAVDRFMAELGRPDRALQFEASPWENAEWLGFLVADPAVCVPVCARLGLPLAERARVS
ncbi:hypothetical protein A4W93_11895 [Piscinibacter gummiphilus]|uniref:Uncharacterized protein n=2 Tax=Piscinibacter gummiphilus TaxID=946333 RepID=A0A1W6L8P3_9BURK|nr:hypothetical protein A4W93_11895 [Piscinibacter gummiphilus]ATU65215.1 hypothetical protein CPZ87_11970 [Piscinibacter gummiphilus]GLS98383.1 hypothetical protein GCM10007918_56750 [Piscinibacter gummiphilus]